MKLINKLLMFTTCVVCLGTSFSCGEKPIKIQLLATSDIHGMLVPFDYALDAPTNKGSLSQIATIIEKYKDDHTLLIDCGDIIQGNYADIFKSQDVHPMIQALNLLNYDVFVTGNHEYNNGIDYLKKQIKGFKGTVLTGNVINKTTYEPLADAFKIFVKGGVRVAVIGMTTSLITRWDGEKLLDYNVTNPIEETKKIVKNIKDNNLADVIVAAEHIGMPKEYEAEGTSCRDLANVCPDIDVIIGAHEHKAYEKEIVNDVLIVENAANAQTLMKIDLEVSKKNYKFKVSKKDSKKINVGEFKSNDAINKFAEPYDKLAKDNARTKIGELANGPMVQDFEIKKVPATYMEPTPLVTFINEVQLAAAKEECKDVASDIKVASTAVGNYTANLVNKDIRKCDCSNIYKYENTLYVLNMNGKQLKEYMEWSVDYYNQYKKGDLTISFAEGSRMPLFNYDMFTGVDYEIDVSKTKGSRITNLKWTNGKVAVQDGDTFKIAINNYRSNSQLLTPGNIYKTKEECPTLYKSDLMQGKGIREIIVDFIAKEKILDANNYSTKNWKIIGNNWDPNKHLKAVEMINDGKLDIGERNTKTITEGDIK